MSFATTDGGTQLARGIPKDAFQGMRALNIQNYNESNIKLGLQYEAAAKVSIATTANNDVIFITAAKPVIFKSRQLQFDRAAITAQVFRAPTYTGGTPVNIFNLNDINPVVTTCQLLSGASVTATGTEFGAPTYGIGSDLQGQAVAGTFSVNGFERILRPNTTYLLRINNPNANTMNVAAYLAWYEGTPDLPLAVGLI